MMELRDEGKRIYVVRAGERELYFRGVRQARKRLTEEEF